LKKEFFCFSSVVLVMKNRNRSVDHMVTVTLRVDTVNYTGRIKEGVSKETTDRLVKAGAGYYFHCVSIQNK
jgi:hypothetical protein